MGIDKDPYFKKCPSVIPKETSCIYQLCVNSLGNLDRFSSLPEVDYNY